MNGLAHAAAPPIGGPALDNKRVTAALIDLVVVVPVGFLVATLSGSFTTGAQVVTVAWVLYYYFALELLTGQTLGKKAMGLRVAQADGSPPELRQVAMRTVLRLVDGLGVYLVGLIAMIATGQRRQRLGDLAAGTIVTTVEEDRPEPADSRHLSCADGPRWCRVPHAGAGAARQPPPAPVPARGEGAAPVRALQGPRRAAGPRRSPQPEPHIEWARPPTGRKPRHTAHPRRPRSRPSPVTAPG